MQTPVIFVDKESRAKLEWVFSATDKNAINQCFWYLHVKNNLIAGTDGKRIHIAKTTDTMSVPEGAYSPTFAANNEVYLTLQEPEPLDWTRVLPDGFNDAKIYSYTRVCSYTPKKLTTFNTISEASRDLHRLTQYLLPAALNFAYLGSLFVKSLKLQPTFDVYVHDEVPERKVVLFRTADHEYLAGIMGISADERGYGVLPMSLKLIQERNNNNG